MDDFEKIDNFEQIENLLTFNNEDEFYMLQLLKRKKENPNMKGDSQPIKTVYLHRKGQLLELKEDLVFLANYTNSRIYLNPNVKSFKKCTCLCLAEMAKRIANDDFHKPYKVFDSVAGSAGACRDTRWVLDVDWVDCLDSEYVYYIPEREKFVEKLREAISNIQPIGDKLMAIIETKNGVHLIVKPFNPNEFAKLYPKVSIHKNNPTLVYAIRY